MSAQSASVHQLVYVSAATAPFAHSELTALLLRARENNRRLGVSGMLIHKDGSFFQVLEGQERIVESLYERISRDPRHTRIVVIRRDQLPRANFADWSMGFVDGERLDVRGMPGFNDFFRKEFADTALKDGGAQAVTLARAFRDGRFRQFVDAR
jgi:hypothetical protein